MEYVYLCTFETDSILGKKIVREQITLSNSIADMGDIKVIENYVTKKHLGEVILIGVIPFTDKFFAGRSETKVFDCRRLKYE